MKGKFLKIAFVSAIAVVAGINVYNAQKPAPLSDVGMANVEALAEGEQTGDKIKCYSSLVFELGSIVVECSSCEAVQDRTDKWNCSSDTCTRIF